MTGLLLDEMFPPAAAQILRDRYGRDAAHVADIGLRATSDLQVAQVARSDGRAIVTENVADFANETEIALVFVLKRNLPSGGAQAAALAALLDRWLTDHPEPYLGHDWPT